MGGRKRPGCATPPSTSGAASVPPACYRNGDGRARAPPSPSHAGRAGVAGGAAVQEPGMGPRRVSGPLRIRGAGAERPLFRPGPGGAAVQEPGHGAATGRRQQTWEGVWLTSVDGGTRSRGDRSTPTTRPDGPEASCRTTIPRRTRQTRPWCRYPHVGRCGPPVETAR